MARRQTATALEAPRLQQLPMLAAWWLILAALFAPILLPVGSPMERIQGSTFSAATIDVAIAPSSGSSAFPGRTIPAGSASAPDPLP
jgi:hypothetical protein